MYKIKKKLIVIALLSLILLCNLASFSGVQASIALQESPNVRENIYEKFIELFGNNLGSNINISISGNNTTLKISGLVKIRSWGRGFHWKSSFGFRIPFTIILKYRLFDIIPLRYKIFGMKVVPRVYCTYLDNDTEAYTEITPLPTPMRPNPDTIRIEGNHTVAVYGFVGYTAWRGTNAQFIDDRGWRTGFDGYASLVACVKFP